MSEPTGPTEPAASEGATPDREWGDENPWQRACPAGDATEAEFAPTFIVHDLGDLYEPLYGDFLDRYGQWGASAPPYPLETRQSIVCTVSDEGFWGIAERLREGSFVPDGPPDCLELGELSISFGRFTYQVFRVHGRYVVSRAADMPGRSGGLKQHRVTARMQDDTIVTEVVTDAYRCPLDREDPCRELEQEDGSWEMICFDDKTACVRAEFNSEIYLTNPTSGKHVRSGLFERRPVPTVDIKVDHAVIESAECRQRAALP